MGCLRGYAGGGLLVGRSPSTIDRGQARVGLNWRSERPLFWRAVPVGALDVSWLERGPSAPNVSVQLGLEIRPTWWDRVRFQTVARYYGGSVPDGQFFRHRTDRVGVGIQVWL